MTNTNQADQLEREIARQLSRDNEIAKLAAKKEAVTAALQAQARLREQAKAMLNNPDLNRKAQLQAKQVKLQSEQLTKRFDDQMVEVNALLVCLGGEPFIKGNVQADTPVMKSLPKPPKLSADDHYKQTIVTEMVALIKQRKKR